MNEPTLALAAVAGLASFLSPCMLPVIPAFLAQLAGTSLGYTELKRRDVLLSTLLFVLGFSTVFAALGIMSSTPCCKKPPPKHLTGSRASPVRW